MTVTCMYMHGMFKWNVWNYVYLVSVAIELSSNCAVCGVLSSQIFPMSSFKKGIFLIFKCRHHQVYLYR